MVGKRRFLNLAAASSLLVSGCATFRGRLRSRHIPGRITAIACRIEIRSHGLVAEHQEFVDSLNSLMSTRDVTEVQLRQSVDSYNGRRKWLRIDLLQPLMNSSGLPGDRKHLLTLQEIVRIRQSMLDVLSESEWDEVFR